MNATVFSVPKVGIPGNVSLSQSDRTDQTAATTNNLSSSSSGYRSSIVNNYALGGSRLDAETSASASAIPMWGWIALGVAGVAFAWYKYGKR
jgi:hypothetical protein